MKTTTVQLDPEQFRQLTAHLGRIEKLLTPDVQEDACPRCGGETKALGQLCAECKLVVEEVPA